MLLLPLKWLAAWVAAAAFHELCHVLMIRRLGYRVLSVTVGLGGAAIETEAMRCRDEFLCAVSGPLGALLLIPLARWLPRTAVCACVQTMYNALPVFPLDGGRALRCLIRRYAPRVSDTWIANAVLIFIGILGVVATFFLGLGPLPLMFAVLLALKSGKFPCKPGKERVQ